MKHPMASALAAAAALLLTPLSQATVISSAYTPLGSANWRVDLTVFNDGAPASITNFTIDFPGFTSLVLLASPPTWDSLLVQPDASIPDAGFLDSLAMMPGNALNSGSLGGFRVQFSYAGTPAALPFVISDSSFTPVFSGMTTATIVPEPAALLLAALGLTVVGLRTSRTRRARGLRPETAAATGTLETTA